MVQKEFVKKLAKILPFIVMAMVFGIFFFKVFFFHLIPFPGDLLVDTSPFKTESYLGYGPGGYPNKEQGRDVITQLYPWNYLEANLLRQGQIPFWNPYNFSGNILMQNYQSGIFYPLDLFFLTFSFQQDWTIFILMQPLMALLFMYLFLREINLGKVSSIIGAVAFAFSSYMTVWLEWGNIDHTLLWLPLILFCIIRLFKSVKIGWFILLIFSLSACILAGYIQGAFYVVALAIFYTYFKFFQGVKKERVISIWFITIGFISAVFISSINIFPSLSFLSFATRGAYSITEIQNLLNPWYYLSTLFVPDFFGNPATRNFFLPITYFERVMYVGIPILFFALYSLKKIKENSHVKFFSIGAIMILLISLNLPGIAYLYRIPIPVIATTVPTRILSIFMFCVVVLSAIGIQNWLKEKNREITLPILFIFTYIFLWLTVLFLPKVSPVFLESMKISEHNLILPTFFAVATLIIFFVKNKAKKLSIILLGILVLADLFYGFNKFTPFSSPTLVYPNTPVLQFLQKNAGIYRSWGYGNAYIPANYQTYYHIYSADGYDSLFLKNYAELLNTSQDGKIHLPLSRTDANISPGYGPIDLGMNTYRQKILDLTGVKYVINLDEGLGKKPQQTGTFPQVLFKLIWQQGPWQVYENKAVLPRFFLTPNYIFKNNATALSAIYKTDLTKTIILSQKPVSPTNFSAKGKVTLLSYSPNKVSFSVTTTGTQFLFLSDSYYSDWKVSIDNVEVPLYRADYAFRAVEVPKGTHTVTFFYYSISFIIGLIIALGGIILGIITIFFYIRKLK